MKPTTIAIIAATSTTVATVLLCIFYRRMKQSLSGTFADSFFTIDELCKTDTNLPNQPSEVERQRLQALITNLLDPVRRAYGSFIRVNSGYRSQAVNRAVGGSTTSQHTRGEAADITGGSVANNRQIFAQIVKLGNFDQLIWEKGGAWVHVSYVPNGGRRTILNYNGKTYANINNNWENVVGIA